MLTSHGKKTKMLPLVSKYSIHLNAAGIQANVGVCVGMLVKVRRQPVRTSSLIHHMGSRELRSSGWVAVLYLLSHIVTAISLCRVRLSVECPRH